MKRRTLPIIVFGIFASLYGWLSMGSYRAAENQCVEDMNQALLKTLYYQHEIGITPDTTKTFRRFLTIEQLKNYSFVTFDVDSGRQNASGVISSDSVGWNKNGQLQAYKGYALCSFTTIFGLSDQRIPTIVLLFGLFSAGLTALLLNRREQNLAASIRYGTLNFSLDEQRFYDCNNQRIEFTPMQFQLMNLFFKAPRHELSQTDICHALWPGKDDAKDTLYTLVRRLRQELAENSDLKIELERGRQYRLTRR